MDHESHHTLGDSWVPPGFGPFGLLTADESEQLRQDLTEIAALRRRGWESAQSLVVG